MSKSLLVRTASVSLLGPVVLGLFACTGRGSVTAKDERTHAEETASEDKEAWDRKVAAEKARLAVVVNPGTSPRRVLSASLAPGEELDAGLSVAQVVDLGGSAGAMKRVQTIHARLRLRGRPPADGRPSIALHVVELTGDLRDLDKLPRTGMIEPGAHGEPWVLVLDSPTSGAGRPRADYGMIWERDVAGWARRVLMPVPSEPVGLGAVWRREWTDYLAGEPVNERHEYQLVSVSNGVAQIKARTSSSAGTVAGDSRNDASATIALPLGRRAVPTSVWVARGSANLIDRGHSTSVTTRATVRVWPYGSPAPAGPTAPRRGGGALK